MIRCRFFLLFLLSLALAGCAQKPSSAPSSSTAQNKSSVPKVNASPRDDLGREVKLNGVPQRIIVIGPGATETVFALGLGHRLVGRDSAADFPAAAKKLAIVGDFSGPAFESVLVARPDLIILQGESWGRARVETWQRKCGAPVAALSATTVAGVAQDIRKIGAWLGAWEKAEILAKSLENTARVTNVKAQPAAIFEIGRAPLWVAGRDTLVSDVMKRAGLVNAAADVEGYKALNLETLATKNPDFYIAMGKQSNRATVMKSLRLQNGVRDLKCVKAGRVLIVDPDLVLRPGPRLNEGIASLRSKAQAMKAKAGA